MSADNGIYIGSFPTANGEKEYRVIHAQAIDNCFYRGAANDNVKMEDAYRMSYFGNATPHTTIEEARKEAWRQHDEIMQSSFPALEYGVSTLDFDRPLVVMTEAEVRAILGF
jgi:hypothetical protein